MREPSLHDATTTRPGRWVVPFGVFAISLLLTLPFRSFSLDDFDSYSFALALDDYDLALQQPQPPGFPVYIALARMVRLICPEPRTALTLVSAVSGAGAAMLVALLGRLIAPRLPTVAYLGAFLYALTPVAWLTAGKALSDGPGVAFTLWSLYLWLVWWSTPRPANTRPVPLLAAVITGLSLGVRPQNALPVAVLVVALCLSDIAHRRRIGPWVGATVLVIATCLAWLVPTAASAGGLGAYVATLRDHAAHVQRADSLIGMALPLGQALRIRLIALGHVLLMSLAGTGLRAASTTAETLRLVAPAIVILPGLLWAGRRRRATRLLALWLLVALTQVFVLETLDRPRLLLPVIPPLALLVASGWHRLIARTRVRPAILCALILVLLVQGVPWVSLLSTVAAPPAQATAYIRGHFSQDRTFVAAAGSFRAAQVTLADYDLAYLYTFDPATVARTLASGVDTVVVIDRDQFTSDAMAVLSGDGALVTLEDRTFTRDRRVHTQHDQVRVQVLVRPELVPLGARALPPDGCLDLGTDGDGRHLGIGWYRAEEIAGTWGRWGGAEQASTVHFVWPMTGPVTLRLRATAYPAGQSVGVTIDDVSLGVYALAPTWSSLDVAVPAATAEPGDVVILTLNHAKASSPFAETGGASSDRRTLTAAYDTICLVGR